MHGEKTPRPNQPRSAGEESRLNQSVSTGGKEGKQERPLLGFRPRGRSSLPPVKPKIQISHPCSEIFYVVPRNSTTRWSQPPTRNAATPSRKLRPARGLRRGHAARDPHAQCAEGAPPRPPLRLGAKGCVPKAKIEKVPGALIARRRSGTQTRKLGQATGYAAIEAPSSSPTNTASAWLGRQRVSTTSGRRLRDGSAKRGYIAYTNCTAALAEVVPFWRQVSERSAPTRTRGASRRRRRSAYPIVIDWATSVVAMGRVQQLAREGKQLPPNAAVDENGQPTTDRRRRNT